MGLFQIILKFADGTEELRDEVFDSEEEAEEYGGYLMGCARTGAETLNMSNPYDNPIGEYDDLDYEVFEIDEDEDE